MVLLVRGLALFEQFKDQVFGSGLLDFGGVFALVEGQGAAFFQDFQLLLGHFCLGLGLGLDEVAGVFQEVFFYEEEEEGSYCCGFQVVDFSFFAFYDLLLNVQFGIQKNICLKLLNLGLKLLNLGLEILSFGLDYRIQV